MLLTLLRQRRSIRKFKPQPVEPEKVGILTEALLRAPSSRGRSPWEFILVDDRELLKRLGRAKEHGAGFLGEAALAVVIAADPARCDVWVEDCSVAATILQLTASSLGLGSCWAQIRLRSHSSGRSAEETVRDILGLPENLAVAVIVGLGYPDEQPVPHDRASLDQSKIHRNGF